MPPAALTLASLVDHARANGGAGIRYNVGADWKTKTFREFANDVDDFANALTRMGVGPRQRVGIMSENRYEWVVCDLAVQQLGCVSVCFPVEEMAARPLSELADTYGLALLVTSARALFRRRPEHWVLNLDGVTTGVSARAVPPLDPEGVCSLAFSSGTAGRLKCLRMAARGAEATIELAARRWGLRSDDRTLIALPLSTFQQRLIVYASIWLGSTMVLTDSPKLFAAIQEGAPTVVIGPPALYQVFEARFNALPAPVRAALRAAAAWARLLPLRVLRGRALKRLFRPFYAALGGAPRVLITGSAPSRRSTLLFFRLVGLPLLEAYGITEGGVIAANAPDGCRLGSVGRPLEAGTVRLAADGEVLFRPRFPQSVGYVDDASEQASTFLTDGSIATGDLGRFDDDGFLYLIGRKRDTIVTRAGYKFHPAPIEAQAAATPGVGRAVIIGGGDLDLCCLVVEPEQAGDEARRRELERRMKARVADLNRTLPGPARLARVVVATERFSVENGLLTRNLKVDRQAVARKF
ncbi:MAG TPA: AMP-binding protein, partial [Polyangia bacterium]|nr:AMP-binding protein [Polyangia bacterium]